MTGKYQMKRTTFLIELSIRKNATFVSGILIKYPDHFHKNFSMINFDKFTLSNGLRVIVHHDPTTPLVAMNILYDVGARDEDPDKTGFAHLFEHLMFGGSINIPSYDEPLQKAGGENNAFTNCDFTNYYLTLPKNNLETAFWLESDRMLDLAFSEKSLEVQRQVVIEEFNQSYLNQPYGDVWLLLKPLAYKVHPYQWNTIGKTTQHIAEATMADVKSFYSRYYNPNNAILSLAGDIQSDEIRVLAEKWFGPIASGPENTRKLPAEPDQKEARTLTVHRDVPTNAIYKAWHSCSRMDKNYIASDLISDILGSGESSVLKKELVKKKRLFSEIDAYITGDIDPGLFIISGKLMPDVSIGEADAAIQDAIDTFCHNGIKATDLQKVKNRAATGFEFSKIPLANRALDLAMYEHLGDINLINKISTFYANISLSVIKQTANEIFQSANCSTLYYLTKSAK
jgi:predicted Zn-dependent peptidase